MAPTSAIQLPNAYGISDTLATNIFAQSGNVEEGFFPWDMAPELKTFSPKGYVDVYPRKNDLENVKNLKFERTKVVMSFEDLKKK